MSEERPSIRPDELAGLFTGQLPGCPDQGVALAVSGGSDSVALMVLFADWLRQLGSDGDRHTVLTVDHRLRAKSGAEARAVAEHAAQLGFRHAVLEWQGAKPQTGLQAAAREARYRLMGDYMAAHGLGTLLVAHTREDQAETLLMRLARGSGLDGLAAMAPSTEVGLSGGCDRVRIVRPLLSVSSARLRATLTERGIAWLEDPSNDEPAFERSRWRAARSDLERLGLSSERLALSARRLRRARAALEAVTDDCCAADGGLVRIDPVGAFRIDRQRLKRTPEEIAMRVIARCITAAGGLREPVSLAGLEPVVARMWGGRPGQAWGETGGEADGCWTLARARIKATGPAIDIEREPGRLPLPVMTVAAGAKVVWDGRFSVEIAQGFEGWLKVRALGRAGLAELKRRGGASKGSPALLLTPAFWRGEELLAVPAVAFWAHAGLQAMISAHFKGMKGLRCN
jgi:tRNA(Ile)-lysidine synthase